MEDYMSQNYPYKFEFAPLETIQNKTGKYADSKLYRYALVFTTHDTHYRYIADSSPSRLVTSGTDFNFFDREATKDYPKTKKYSSYPMMTFKPVINTIVKRFE